MTKHFFAGAATDLGFVNLFSNIIDRDKANAFFIIKGGSGIGKSSLMKKIAKPYLDKNFEVEYFHCSSDIESLDGIVIPALSVALVDGTAPHIIDPKYVKCNEFNIDLSVAIDEKKVAPYFDDLREILKDKKLYFDNAYNQIKLASEMYLEEYNNTLKYIDNKLVSNFVNKIIANLNVPTKKGYSRQLFSSAITSSGHIKLESFYPTTHVLCLNNNPYVSNYIIYSLYMLCNLSNIKADIFYNPLTTKLMDGININNEYFFTTNPNIDSPNKDEIDASKFLTIDNYKPRYETYKNSFINTAISYLKRAKGVHKEIESIYTPSVNFKIVDEITSDIQYKIENI